MARVHQPQRTSAAAQTHARTQDHQSFKRARARRRHADRQLVPVPVAKLLGIPVAQLAEVMRELGMTQKLTMSQARCWVADPSSAPGWLSVAAQRAELARQQDQDRAEPELRPRTRGREQRSDRSRGPGSGDNEQARLEEFLRELRAVSSSGGRGGRGGSKPRRR